MTNALIADRDRFAAAHPETRIVLGGREWGYVAAGDKGPALLLIPGTLGRGDVFWQQIEALKDRARVVAVTYPKSGGVAEWADDLAALCRHLGLERVTVLGSSLGGYVAQYFAATHPALTERLIRGEHAALGRRGRDAPALFVGRRQRTDRGTARRLRQGPRRLARGASRAGRPRRPADGRGRWPHSRTGTARQAQRPEARAGTAAARHAASDAASPRSRAPTTR